MGFGGIIGRVASKAISSSVDTKGIAQQVASHVDIPGVMNKIPGMNNPKLAPIKKDIEDLMNTQVSQGTNTEMSKIMSQINNPDMDTSLLSNMDSEFLGASGKADSAYPEGQQKANTTEGQNKVTSTMETKIKEISDKSGTQVEMPKFNLDLGGQSNE